MTTLAQLLSGVDVLSIRGPADALAQPIVEVRDDSRKVSAGDLFVAVRGQSVDGHDYVEVARSKGAVAVVVERDVVFDGTVIRVADGARALAQLAANRYGRPAEAMTLVGITGTNGKTTSTYLVEALLREGGKVPGVIGTVAYRSPAGDRPAPFTTPTPLALHATLAEMRDAGCTHVVMECSSHALALDRLAGLRFAVAAFSNLTQDHLDFHADMDDYADAKALLFSRHLAEAGNAVICVDGPYGERMVRAASGRVLRVSATTASGDVDVHVRSKAATASGTHLVLATPLGELDFTSPLIGDFNVENLVVATGIGCALGLSTELIARSLSATHGAPGRLERVRDPRADARDIAAYVDYAHTPDALERVLAAVRPTTRGRLWVVFGCGGDRDRGKRPQMGRIAAAGADLAVVTSDNPRSEDPQRILDDILAGMEGGRLREDQLVRGARGHVALVDRRAAIALAVRLAEAGDVIVIAGKGHESYQIVGAQKLHFDDREEVVAALARIEGTETSATT